MHVRLTSGTASGANTAQQRILDRRLAEDLLFLRAWEKGLVPWPGAVVRVRQIRRANPSLAGSRERRTAPADAADGS